MSRGRFAAYTFTPPTVMAALAGVQVFLTSPGVVTDVEFRALLLAAIPACTVILAARWVDRGARPIDRDLR